MKGTSDAKNARASFCLKKLTVFTFWAENVCLGSSVRYWIPIFEKRASICAIKHSKSTKYIRANSDLLKRSATAQLHIMRTRSKRGKQEEQAMQSNMSNECPLMQAFAVIAACCSFVLPCASPLYVSVVLQSSERERETIESVLRERTRQ